MPRFTCSRYLLTSMLAGAATLVAAQPAPGPGGMNAPERKLLSMFDRDGNGRLDRDERQAARADLAAQRTPDRGFGGRPGRGGPDAALSAPTRPGPKVAPSEVEISQATLYDPGTVRTLFLTFDTPDWEAELEAFHNSDVEVPATLQVDGHTYEGVGVAFRGASSYMRAPRGSKRSLNVKIDHTHDKQALMGYRTLNLNNAFGDPSLMRAVVYTEIAKQYLPVPASNHVRLVINGESWGVYTNTAQFNKDFLRDHFQTPKGARWKVPGQPRDGAGLIYQGEDLAAYKARYEIKTQDNDDTWKALVRLTRVLHETPPAQLPIALAPLLDIDGTLRFLALENVLANSDGYWSRGSDFSLYLDPKGQFHVIPHDVNEAMMSADMHGGGPGRGMGSMGQGPGGASTDLDPLVAARDPSKPLISRLLAVPELRTKYLTHVREIATRWLDWSVLGPVVERHRALIEAEVRQDTRKLTSTEAFEASVQGLRQFAEARRKFLLEPLR